MIFHLGFELPELRQKGLDEHSADLTPDETDIIRGQIKKNAELITEYVNRLDLLVNKEKHPKSEAFVKKIRQYLYLLMEENDTFRKVLWKHMQREMVSRLGAPLPPKKKRG